jgi:energy-coupling factor transporter transmembrane protein EcfT
MRYDAGMNMQFYKDALGWGIALWLIGYILGFVLFMVVPVSAIGWVVMPIGIAITLWVLVKKIRGTLGYFALVGTVWALIAIMCDYVFLVMLLHPADGYYKLDVYLYYMLTFALPFIVGFWKRSKAPEIQ